MMLFCYERLVQFYETDLMGVVHHTNYLRLCEEARVAWLQLRKLNHLHGKSAGCLFAVYKTQVLHLKPAYFEDKVRIELQVKLDGARIIYQYKMYTQRFDDPIATAQTEHVPVNAEMKVIKLPVEMREVLRREKWIETWL